MRVVFRTPPFGDAKLITGLLSSITPYIRLSGYMDNRRAANHECNKGAAGRAEGEGQMPIRVSENGDCVHRSGMSKHRGKSMSRRQDVEPIGERELRSPRVSCVQQPNINKALDNCLFCEQSACIHLDVIHQRLEK